MTGKSAEIFAILVATKLSGPIICIDLSKDIGSLAPTRRINLWRNEVEFSDVADKFTHSTIKRVEDRIKKWSEKRNQKLFGQTCHTEFSYFKFF